MDKIRAFLSITACGLALSGVFASQSSTLIDAYRMTGRGIPIAIHCIYIGQCNNQGTFRCRSVDPLTGVTVELYQINYSGTACDQPLYHSSIFPI